MDHKYHDKKINISLLNSGTSQDHQTFGAVTDLQIWNESKSIDEISKWSKCEMNSKGNIFNWDLMAQGTPNTF